MDERRALASPPSAATAYALAPDTKTRTQKREVILVIDRSGSMSDPTTDGQPKWDALRNALQMVLPRLGDDLSVGVTFFPATLAPREAGTYSPAEVCNTPTRLELEPAPANIPLILDRFNTTQPSGPTPTALSLRLVRDWFLAHVERIVLVAEDAESQRIGTAVIPLEQRAERVAIALPSRADQVVVIDRSRGVLRPSIRRS
mgnify:CR=1 FL=1